MNTNTINMYVEGNETHVAFSFRGNGLIAGNFLLNKSNIEEVVKKLQQFKYAVIPSEKIKITNEYVYGFSKPVDDKTIKLFASKLGNPDYSTKPVARVYGPMYGPKNQTRIPK